jgi:nitroreductase
MRFTLFISKEIIVIKLIRERRSIRKYLSKPIPMEIIDELKETALRSPTSRNRKEWKFWFITDPETLAELATAKAAGSQMISQAALAVVIGADESLCDVWVEDCSIAATLIQMNAQSHGIGSVWVQIRERFAKSGESSEDRVKTILNVKSESIRIASIVSLGYADEEKAPIQYDSLNWDAIER